MSIFTNAGFSTNVLLLCLVFIGISMITLYITDSDGHVGDRNGNIKSNKKCVIDGDTNDNKLSDVDLKNFAEEVLKKDVSGLSSKVTANKQGKTNSGSAIDRAPDRLLTVSGDALKYETVKLLVAMFDNYDPDVKNAEVVTDGEVKEEELFLNAVLDTDIMKYTLSFLNNKDLFNGDKSKFKDFLKSTWFSLYSRGHRKKSSSAFEHVFLGELKLNQVSGLHNWIYFNDQETKNNLNYMGYMRDIDFGKGMLLKVRYNWKGSDKPVGTLFVGTSPELEMALYTVCYLARPNGKCDFTLNNKPMFIQTYTFIGPKQQKLIGSAFPGL